MRQHSEFASRRPSPRESVVTVTIRTPEAAKALNGASWVMHLIAWVIGTAVLIAFAWAGGFGETPHGYVRLTIAVAVLYWATHSALRLWQTRDRVTSLRLTASLTPETLTIDQPEPLCIRLTGREVRFAARPHWQARREERDERHVGHPVGYEYRDAWEVWCEAGLDVTPIAALATEDDARALVRHLTEEYVFVTRGDAPESSMPRRVEPA